MSLIFFFVHSQNFSLIRIQLLLKGETKKCAMTEFRLSDEDVEFSDDVRVQELQSLVAIYPETTKIDLSTLSGSIDILIVCDQGVLLKLREKEGNGELQSVKRSAIVQFLPPITLKFSLTNGYPADEPPVFEVLSTVLSDEVIETITTELTSLWDEFRSEVLFSFADLVKNKVDYELEQLIGKEINCTEDEKFDGLFSFNKAQTQQKFDELTFSCEICQNDFKGSVCSKFEDCQHVFCNSCLYDFFHSLIETGEIEKVHCPNYECNNRFVKLREKYSRSDDLDLQKTNWTELKERYLSPPISIDLLRTILTTKSNEEAESLIKRYLDLFSKQQHEVISRILPTRLTPCPQCPEMIFRDDSESLVVCQKCRFAFCYYCRKSWHGKYSKCTKKANGGKYADIPIKDLETWLESDKDSVERRSLGYQYGRVLIKKLANEYLMDKMFNELLADENLGLTKCPTCEIIIQRADGCNKMCCSTCKTFFCNLCGSFLDPSDPYEHFRTFASPCYGRLFEGMAGVDD